MPQAVAHLITAQYVQDPTITTFQQFNCLPVTVIVVTVDHVTDWEVAAAAWHHERIITVYC